MLSELIVLQVQRELKFGVGAALGMVLLALTLVLLAVASRFVRIGDAVGYGSE